MYTDPVRVVDKNYEPVLVALDVEDNAAVPYDAGAGVSRLDSGWGVPVRVLRFAVPGEQRLLSIRVMLPELAQSLVG